MNRKLQYCTLDDVKTEAKQTSTDYDSEFTNYIVRASQAISEYKDAIFAPVIGTRYYSPSDLDMYGKLLLLNDDLLAITSISISDTSKDTALYTLHPRGTSPASAIKGTWSGYSGIDSIAITGVWGYVTYPATSEGTLDSGITASGTTIAVTGNDVVAGMYLLIDSELFRVSSVTGADITVVRAVNGSTAATHDAGATVTGYLVDYTVQHACARWAAYMWTRKGGFQRVQAVGDNIVQYPDDVPQDIAGLLNRISVPPRIYTI